jgi:hypothetical protein
VFDVIFQKKNLALFALLILIWAIFHQLIGLITKGIGEPAFSTAAPLLADIIAMLIALMATKRSLLWAANIALIDIFLSALFGNFSALINFGKEGLANTLYVMGLLTGLMANAKYFGRKYFEKKLKMEKRRKRS